MSNMSYCRFENTYSDLVDCLEVFESDGNIESVRERKIAERMIARMVDFLYEQDIIETYPDDYKNRIQEMVNNVYREDED